jgi:hypothetical protein
MILDDLVAQRRRVIRTYQPKRKRGPHHRPELMMAFAASLVLGLWLGLTPSGIPSQPLEHSGLQR